MLKTHKRNEGFTIIEVLIVLAIAGLILVIVFLAVPNLQRSARNNSRKTDGSNLLAALNDYVGNNGGAQPATACTKIGTTAGQCAWLNGAKLGYFDPNNVAYVNLNVAGATVPTISDAEHLYLIAGASCSNGAAGAPTAATSSRQNAVYYGIEGNTKTQCVDS